MQPKRRLAVLIAVRVSVMQISDRS